MLFTGWVMLYWLLYGYATASTMQLIQDPTPINSTTDHFQYRALYWKGYTHRMKSGDETNNLLVFTL